MSIHIIGASSGAEEPRVVLPTPEADLPHPSSVPANHRLLDEARIRALLGHERALVRSFGIEQVATHSDAALLDALIPLVADPSERVAIAASSVLGRKEHAAAVDALAARFTEAGGELGATLAEALGPMAPERLFELVRSRARLDDVTYSGASAVLAIAGRPEAVEFLGRALTRSGVLSPERRSALYGAALLSGHPELCGRVMDLALADSTQEEPQDRTFPPRLALASFAQLDLQHSTRSGGLELYDLARETLEKVVMPVLSPDQAAALEEALKKKRPALVLEAMAPLISLPEPETAGLDPEVAKELGTMPARRRGFLMALVARRAAVGRLELNAAALFIATAAQAAEVLIASLDEAKSPGMVALGKAQEPQLEPHAFSRMDLAALTQLFREKSPREMRRLTTVLCREDFPLRATRVRLARAMLAAGHGESLFAAAAESRSPLAQSAVLRAAEEQLADAEVATLELLGATPLEEGAVAFALHVAELVRTERVGLLLGRRFLELRPINRSVLSRAMMRTGDARLIPVLESRAFAEEPEELAWVVLSLVSDRPVEGRLAEALARVERDGETAPARQEVRLPLRCKRCQEVLVYGFKHVHVDPEAADEHGDPAFVGDAVCKACGAEEQLEPTREGSSVLAAHLLQFAEQARAGMMREPPLVSPASINLEGRAMGLAAALRLLDERIAVSPSAIRPRLQRARLRIILERKGAQDDLSAVYAEEPEALEGLALEAPLAMRAGDFQRAMDCAARAVRRLREEDEPRLYDTEDPLDLLMQLEEYMVELRELGASAPEDLDLSGAEDRLKQQAIDQEEALAAARLAAESGEPPEGPARGRGGAPKKGKRKGR